MKEIACFVSPHGFGHATRAIAVVEALQRLRPDVHAHFYTTVPRFLFAESLDNFTHHPMLVDVGLAQNSAMDSDLPATIDRLDKLLPYRRDLIEDLACRCAKCSFILCDIAPLGIAVARHAGLPSILVENFTWDWIYQHYADRYPGLSRHQSFLQKLFAKARYRIQTDPLCAVAPRNLFCGPIFRKAKGSRSSLREELGCGEKNLVLVTMGGVFQRLPAFLKVEKFPDYYFLFTGQPETKRLGTNLALLSRDSGHYHPDLLSAADIVVCKAGYSTVAECCQAGVRVISVGRADFPESEPLQRYLAEQLGGVEISPESYQDGSWMAIAESLLSSPRSVPATENGADEVAAFLVKLLE